MTEASTVVGNRSIRSRGTWLTHAFGYAILAAVLGAAVPFLLTTGELRSLDSGAAQAPWADWTAAVAVIGMVIAIVMSVRCVARWIVARGLSPDRSCR